MPPSKKETLIDDYGNGEKKALFHSTMRMYDFSKSTHAHIFPFESHSSFPIAYLKRYVRAFWYEKAFICTPEGRPEILLYNNSSLSTIDSIVLMVSFP